ncbi:kinase-like protein [Setomelanomma holmii]|uniref:Kinase-like protein n=1 Tax=Setomelanomma holmii TaxID=210430 RepID=A0A9P4HCR1_9PLEO|nr:kinase-like protein [Setomelanomma holmii]
MLRLGLRRLTTHIQHASLRRMTSNFLVSWSNEGKAGSQEDCLEGQVALSRDEETSAASADEETSTGDIDPQKEDRIVIEDWSQTARGSHVDFDHAETVPLEQVCDLHIFFEDVEAWTSLGDEFDTRSTRLRALEIAAKERLEALEYDFPVSKNAGWARLVCRMIGCLISAINFVHDQRIGRKDLKPSNVLLSRGCLWLSDFGSATDFSMMSQSATNNERGTPHYFAPEVASWQPNGRVADVCSLDCILLEIITLHDRGTLDHIRHNRSSDPAFHENLDQVSTWCRLSIGTTFQRRRLLWYIRQEVMALLEKDPMARLTAKQLLHRCVGYDCAEADSHGASVFGDCCRHHIIFAKDLEEERSKHSKQKSRSKKALDDTREWLTKERSTVQDREVQWKLSTRRTRRSRSPILGREGLSRKKEKNR